MMVVAFYTPAYERYLPAFEESCRVWGLRRTIRPIMDRGSYQKNVAFKAEFLLQKLVDSRDDVLYVDVDATFESPPSLFGGPPIQEAMAVHYWKATPKDDVPRRLLGGTIYLNAQWKRSLILLLDDWILENHLHPDKTDQENLETVILRHKKVPVLELPAGYCWLESVMRPFRKKEQVVINHLGVSRERWMKK